MGSVVDSPLLRNGPQRNGQLLRQIGGSSQRMLTQTLRELEQRRLIIRTVRKEVPPHVEYKLSALGQSLAEAIATLDNGLFIITIAPSTDNVGRPDG